MSLAELVITSVKLEGRSKQEAGHRCVGLKRHVRLGDAERLAVRTAPGRGPVHP
jgi:hypothetical protein